MTKKVCPRCKLPYEGISECEYCGLVFDSKTKLKAKNIKTKIKVNKQMLAPQRTQPKITGRKTLMFIIAIFLGFLSGFLIYFEASMVFVSDPKEISSLFVFITFFGGWILSTYIIIRGAVKISKVFSRGFLIGAAKWFAMIPIVIFSAGIKTSETIQKASSDAEVIGAGLGFGFISFFSTGLAISMTIICLIGFVISYLIGREMKKEDETVFKKCPYCAETIKIEAIKCRCCGSELQET